MSCCTTHTHTTACDPANEPLASSLNNIIVNVIGSLTKTCVNNEIVWILPCDLEAGASQFPRNSGESLACYFLRFMQAFTAAQVFAIGNKGYRSTALVATDVVLFRAIDVANQDFTGTLGGPVDIILSSNQAVNGDEFYLSFTNLVITATNNIEIMSDGTSLLLINTPGTLNGYLKAVYTGTAWKLTHTFVSIT